MKKLFSAVIAIMVCMSASYAQKTHTLVSRVLEDYDEISYFYNEQGLVDSIYQHQFTDRWCTTYETNVYDEKGNLLRNNLYQKFDTGWKHNSIVEYTYNEKGLLSHRINYNNFGGFSKQGDMEYIYNEKDQLTNVNVWMDEWGDPEKKRVTQKETYTYENDLLVSSVIETNDDPFGIYGGDPENPTFSRQNKTTYQYGEDGRLLSTQDYVYDYTTGEAVEKEAGLVKYTYDGHGNVVQSDYYLRSKNSSARKVYHYDTMVLKEKAVFPFYFESELNEWVRVQKMSSNIITEEEEWQIPNEADTLMFLGSYIWDYDVEEDPTGNKPDQKAASLRWTVDNDVLKIAGAPVGCRIEIFTAEGRLIRQTRYADGVNLGALPAGVYIARINGRASVKFVYSR